jgi:hypothetical protein
MQCERERLISSLCSVGEVELGLFGERLIAFSYIPLMCPADSYATLVVLFRGGRMALQVPTSMTGQNSGVHGASDVEEPLLTL